MLNDEGYKYDRILITLLHGRSLNSDTIASNAESRQKYPLFKRPSCFQWPKVMCKSVHQDLEIGLKRSLSESFIWPRVTEKGYI